MNKVVACDLGGTRLKSGLAHAGTMELEMAQVEDLAGSAEDALMRIEAAAVRMRALADGRPMAVCCPGLVNEDGLVSSLPGKLVGLEGQNLRTEVARRTGVEPIVVNDAVAFGVGEAVLGGGRGSERVVVVTVGTGIGVTVLQLGEPVSPGPLGGGVLGGFIPIADVNHGPLDSNGRPDTIEAFCRAERLLEYAGAAYPDIRTLYLAHHRGEAAAVSAVSLYRHHLARALTALAHAHSPEVIVVGGGPMAADTPLLEGIEEAVNSRLYGSYRTAVRRAALGENAALFGLAWLASESTR